MSKFKTLQQRITRDPLSTGSMILLVIHVLMLVMTLTSHGFPVFIIQNLAGILFLGTMLILKKHQLFNQLNAVLLVVVGVWIQIHVSIAVLGVDAGFQYYFFSTLATGFYLTYSTKSEKTSIISIFIEITSLLMYLMSVLHGKMVKPVYVINERDLFMTSLANIFFTLVGITYFADCYRNQLKSSVLMLQRAADRDELTKLYNRRGIRYFFEKLQERWERENQPYAVAILDIDDFKEINDTWGHNEGDKVLVAIAEVLSSYAGDTSWCCRWGGEEFLILSYLNRSRYQNLQVLNRILEDIRKIRIEEGSQTIQVTVTIGCAFSEPDMLIHELINKADNALYRGKSSGKNQVVLAD